MTQQTAFPFAAPAKEEFARRNLVIEAGAGTGKTTRIVAEVLRLLSSDETIAADRIVLMTFTEKAAGEIADRIRGGLLQLASSFDEERVSWPPASRNPLLVIEEADRDRARRACAHHLANIDRLRSQTIHSFCQSLLRTFPIEANLDPQFKIIEGFERQILHDELYDRWIHGETSDRKSETAGDWELLFEQFNYLSRITDLIFGLVERRDLLAEGLSIGDFSEVEDILRDAFRGLALSEANVTHRETVRVIEHARREALPPVGATLDDWLTWMRPIASSLRESEIKIKDPVVKECIRILRGKDKGKSIYDRLLSHRSAEALLRITRRFVTFLGEEKRKLGVADFDDLLLRTDELLGIEEIRLRAKAQFDYIFVDEFQDTDRTQARILTKLCTSEDGAWFPGRTIVVGDPKQSIYGFRRADPETYAAVTSAMIAGGAQPDEILDQYRSDPPLLDAINAIFVALFGAGSDDRNVFQPKYEDLRAGRPAARRELDARITFLHAAAANKGDRQIEEAESIAAWIREHGGDDLRRVALLFRRMTKLDDYLDVFDRHGIEYVLPPTRLFLDRRAAVDLLAVLRAIAYPFDRGAQVSAARTPYFALTDEEIGNGLLLKESEGAWGAFESAIARFRISATHLTVAQLVDHVIRESGIEAIYSMTRDRDRSLRHLEHLRTIAFTFDERSGGSVRQFVDQIAMRREEPDEMEPSLADESRNAIRIMTVHASKGLEFNTVILADLEFGGGGGGVQLFATDQPKSLVVSGEVESISGNFREWNGEPLKNVRGARDEAELKRLFYVAVTRAESEVVLVLEMSPESRAQGFRKCINGLFGFDAKTSAPPFPECGREVRRVSVAGRPVEVAFERLQLLSGTASTRVRLAPDTDEEALRKGGLVAADIPVVRVIEPDESQREIAQLRSSGSGRDAGILLHRVLEVWDGNGDPDRLLRQLAAEGAFDERIVSTVRQRINVVRRSESFRKVFGAECLGREMVVYIPSRVTGYQLSVIGEQPVSHQSSVISHQGATSAPSSGDHGDATPFEVRRIDRLIRLDGIEVVVDYKSGRANAARIERDSAQVRAYCAAISAMTGRPCSGLLWYIDLERDQLVVV